MEKLLLAWAAKEDLAAKQHPEPEELGPTLRAARDLSVDRVALLSNAVAPKDRKAVKAYAEWLATESSAKVDVEWVTLEDPTDHVSILDRATECVERHEQRAGASRLHFLLSSGTPAMHAVWLLLAKSRFHASLVQCTVEQGTKLIDLPFEISTDFAAELLEKSDERLVRLTQGLPPEQPAFSQVIGASRPMKEAVAIASRLAPRGVPVLVTGESGTGKELFARAIHASSPRKDATFLALNCGAIPPELIDSRLFGHAKGSFTGATSAATGVFEDADGGTLFLDEIGELPLEAQVRLLRTIQESEVSRVGENKPRKVNVRIIAATHVDLFRAVDTGDFRRDLLYRLAVGIVHLPPLRDRGKDQHKLIDTLLDEVQKELFLEPDFVPRKLASDARSRLLRHPWPGNVRELRTTLVRAALYSSGRKLTLQDIEDALLPIPGDPSNGILGRPFDGTFDLKALQQELRDHYVERALEQSGGNQAKASKLMNTKPQTFSGWVANK